MDQAAQKRPGGQHHRATADPSPVCQHHSRDSVLRHGEIHDFPFDNGQSVLFTDSRLHRLTVELAVGLRARAANRRPFATIEKPELDTCRIGNPPHEAVQSVDLANQVPLAQSADGWIAGHCSYGVEAKGYKGCARAGPRGGGGGVTTSVATPDNYNVIGIVHCLLRKRRHVPAPVSCQERRFT